MDIANDESYNVSSLAFNLDVNNVFIAIMVFIFISFPFFFVFEKLLNFQCSFLVLDEITLHPWIIPPLSAEAPYVFQYKCKVLLSIKNRRKVPLHLKWLPFQDLNINHYLMDQMSNSLFASKWFMLSEGLWVGCSWKVRGQVLGYPLF